MKKEDMEIQVIDKHCYGDILDLGCGEGRLYPLLSVKGDSYFGIDFEEDKIKKATSCYPSEKFLHESILNYKTETKYDIVFAGFNTLDELEDVIDKERLIKIIKRLLKRDGLLIFSTKNRYYIKVFAHNFLRRPYYRYRNGNKIILKGNNIHKIKKFYSEHFKFIEKYGGIFDTLNYLVFKNSLDSH